VGGQHHAPAALPPGKIPLHICRRQGGPHGRYGWGQKMALLMGFETWAVHAVASRYTDYAATGISIQTRDPSHSA